MYIVRNNQFFRICVVEFLRNNYSPQCRREWWMFTSPLRGSVNIHNYSPPTQWIIINYYLIKKNLLISRTRSAVLKIASQLMLLFLYRRGSMDWVKLCRKSRTARLRFVSEISKIQKKKQYLKMCLVFFGKLLFSEAANVALTPTPLCNNPLTPLNDKRLSPPF